VEAHTTSFIICSITNSFQGFHPQFSQRVHRAVSCRQMAVWPYLASNKHPGHLYVGIIKKLFL